MAAKAQPMAAKAQPMAAKAQPMAAKAQPMAAKAQLRSIFRGSAGRLRSWVTSGRLPACVFLLLVALTAAGCGQGGDDSTKVPSSSTVTSADPAEDRPARPDPDELTDGVRQVTVDSADPAAGTITVDGVEVLEGTEAVLAYLADTGGNQLEGPQVYVRNAREELQDLPVDPEGEFAVIFGPECCEPQDQGWQGFAELAGSGFPDVWGVAPPFEVTISDGTVMSLSQTYIP